MGSLASSLGFPAAKTPLGDGSFLLNIIHPPPTKGGTPEWNMRSFGYTLQTGYNAPPKG